MVEDNKTAMYETLKGCTEEQLAKIVGKKYAKNFLTDIYEKYNTKK